MSRVNIIFTNLQIQVEQLDICFFQVRPSSLEIDVKKNQENELFKTEEAVVY